MRVTEGPLARAARFWAHAWALLQEVSRDFLLREELVTNSTTLVAEYTKKEKVESATANVTNHLIYSIYPSPTILQQLKISFGQQRVDERQFIRM